MSDHITNNNHEPETSHRTKLPAPMVPREQISIWSILKNCIGKELYKITMPVVFNEPLTMLQRACECIQYSDYLRQADICDDPIERMELICTFIIAGLSANCERIIKPFNPLLYETYEITHKLGDGSEAKALAQQVSHHPPITATYAEADTFLYHGSVNPKMKFWGRTIEIHPDGHCRVFLKKRNENYIFKSVCCTINNIIVGKLWFEHTGPLEIKCPETGMVANLDFKQSGWFSNDIHRFDGYIANQRKKLRYIYGKWSDYMKSVAYSDYEQFLKTTSKKTFKIPDTDPDAQNNNNRLGSGANSLANRIESLSIESNQGDQSSSTLHSHSNHNMSASLKNITNDKMPEDQLRMTSSGSYTKSDSAQSLDIPNSKTLWRLDANYLAEYYNFTEYTLRMNELTPELSKILPRTDTRFRPDVRRLEEGDLNGAASEKERLEEKQRATRAIDKRFKEPSMDFLWFKYSDLQFTKEKFWIYRGGYWENKCNIEKFPEIF